MRILLFTGLLLGAVGSATADIIVTRGIVHTGQVVKASSAGVMIKVGANEFTVGLADVLRAEIPKPELFDKSIAAQRTSRNQDALSGFRTLTERYGGLRVPWVEESLMRLSEVQVALRDYAGAKRSLDTFRALYPKSNLLSSLEAKYARLLFEQKETEKAQQAIEPVVESLLKNDWLTEEQEASLAEGLVLLGDCLAASNKLDEALDTYLRVTTLFDVDEDRTAEAGYKAARILEQRNQWKRAKPRYEALLRDYPNTPFADDIKKRLAAHTE